MTRYSNEQAAPVRSRADAEHRGGSTTCSSDEASVTGREAKGVCYSAIECDQPVREESQKVVRSFNISEKLVWQAFLRVKSSKGAVGVDG